MEYTFLTIDAILADDGKRVRLKSIPARVNGRAKLTKMAGAVGKVLRDVV